MIDQSNDFAPQSVRNVSDIGQSFTPTLTGIDFATFYITSLATLVTLRLYSEEGFSGTLLGTAGPFGLASTNPLAPTSYSFASTISLVPGQLYTLRLTATSGVFASSYSSANPYIGGDIFDDAGSRPTFDLRFAEGINTVAEPGTWAMMVTGFGLLGSALQRRARGEVARLQTRTARGRRSRGALL